MNVFESMMQGLTEAVSYEKGEQTARSASVTIAPPPEVSADEVKELRQSLHMTQRTFAALMGVSNKTVEAWEAGTNHPSGAASRILNMMEIDKDLIKRFPFVTNVITK